MDWQTSWNNINTSSKRGGQGEVFKVQNKTNDSIFGALKVMHQSQATSTNRRDRFQREVEALQKIEISSIPKVLEFDIQNSSPYFISEWIEGKDLNEFLDKNEFTVEKALLFTRQLALVVDSCHQKGIIHRDIKPENILVRDWQPILVDFGISWTFDENENIPKTPIGEELGNRFLRLPELTAGSQEKHEKISDVTFVVGILFYLITKKYPRQLKDSDDRMPHDRLTMEEKALYQSDRLWSKTKRIFNVGFQQSSSLRFQSNIELISNIDAALNIDAVMNNEDELDEIKKQLLDLINTDELKQRRKAVEKFKLLNNKLYNEISSEISQNGTTVSNNESSSASSHRKNMYILNDMFQSIQTVLCHSIEIVGNSINCSYAIKENRSAQETFVLYYSGYITDLETLEEAITKNKDRFLKEAILAFSNQLKKNGA